MKFSLLFFSFFLLLFIALNVVQLYSVAANGVLNLWRCNTQLDGLEPFKKKEFNATEIEEEVEGGNKSSKKSRLEGKSEIFPNLEFFQSLEFM